MIDFAKGEEMAKIVRWYVNCEFCKWNRITDTRREAITLGHGHVGENHDQDDEWSFRVRGYAQTPEEELVESLQTT